MKQWESLLQHLSELPDITKTNHVPTHYKNINKEKRELYKEVEKLQLQ